MAVEPTHRVANHEFTTGERLLALEVRSQKFAFAVIQGSELIDWGARGFRSGAPEAKAAMDRFAFLLKLYAPSMVITRQTRRAKDKSSQNALRVFRMIRGELKRRSVPFEALARTDVRKFFSERGCKNKHEIAAIVADQFSQLKSRLPRSRKPWDPEPPIVAVFDAIAIAFAFDTLRASSADA